jgi:hypothetical protein
MLFYISLFNGYREAFKMLMLNQSESLFYISIKTSK